MASPPQGRMRPSRYLFTLAGIYVVLFGVLLGFGTGSISDRLKPRLGLDLIGGTTLTLVAKTLDNNPPSADVARAGPRDHPEPGGRVRRRRGRGGDRGRQPRSSSPSPARTATSIRQVGVPAQLRFRKVLQTADGPARAALALGHPQRQRQRLAAAPVAGPAPAPAAAPTATPARHATASQAPATPTPSPRGGERRGGERRRPRPPRARRPAPGRSRAAGRRTRQRKAVLAKLGPAAAAAEQIQDPKTVAADPATRRGVGAVPEADARPRSRSCRRRSSSTCRR